ncbi:arsenate reductase ArsC [Endozoicomonas sp.]|nr:arsenate reductase ArsC [Endozoicomonas sp.]
MKLLFLCTHNACRSILAEAIGKKLSGGRITVKSAGSAPAGRVHPLTLEQLKKKGFPIEGLSSQSWDELDSYQPDIVITVCDSAAGESCPLWMNKAVKLHWGLMDPTHLSDDNMSVSEAFETVMATLEDRMNQLLALDLNQPMDELKPALQALSS